MAIIKIATNNFGYHKDCYRKFTKNADRLKGDDPPPNKRRLQSRSMSKINEWNDGILFHPDCSVIRLH